MRDIDELAAFIKDLERPFILETPINGDTSQSFEILTGTIPVMVSAPHSVSQYRMGSIKQAEYRTGPLAIMLHSYTGCHAIYKTKNVQDDANFDDLSLYRDTLVEYIRSHQIQYLIDLHVMSPLRDHLIDLGTGRGKNIQSNFGLVSRIADVFSANSVQQVAVDKMFTAGLENTVSATVAREADIFALQIEMNWRLLNLSSGTRNQLNVLQSLVQIVDYLNGGW